MSDRKLAVIAALGFTQQWCPAVDSSNNVTLSLPHQHTEGRLTDLE